VRRRRPGHGHADRTPELSFAGIFLALASSVVWGVADFSGGSLTRRLPTFGVTVVSQSAGFVFLCVAVGARGDLGVRSFWLGLLAGVGGGSGLAAFYRALSLGTMSIVSPLVACGAVVPFAISLATGERPSPLAIGGAVVALGGAVMASLEEHRSESRERSQAVMLAVVAALALGLFVYFLGLGSRQGDALSTLFGARVGSLAFLVVAAAASRSTLRVPRASLLAVAAVGVADVSANALFALASSHGLLAIVSVLGSLYPIVTVLLAYALLHERLTRLQQAGVVAALVGVVAISAT
jgi:drug/metabolite transporter (DMT)-like permease